MMFEEGGMAILETRKNLDAQMRKPTPISWGSTAIFALKDTIEVLAVLSPPT